LDTILRELGQTDSKRQRAGHVHRRVRRRAAESLPRWRDQATAEESAAQGASAFSSRKSTRRRPGQLAAGSMIPMLSGKPLADLQNAIKTYGDTIKAVHLPGGEETDAQHEASMNLILIADLLPRAADDIVTWSKTTDSSTRLTTRCQHLAARARGHRRDRRDGRRHHRRLRQGPGLDQLHVRRVEPRRVRPQAGPGPTVIIPPLQTADTLLDTLIAYQAPPSRRPSPTPATSGSSTTPKRTLMTQTLDLYNTTVPGGVATFGGGGGRPGRSHATIKAWRDSLAKFMSPNGYDDKDGHHESIAQYPAGHLRHRKTPTLAAPGGP